VCSAPCLLFSRCVQLPTHADNVALPVFTRRTPLLQQSIDISCPPCPQQQTRRTLLQWANGTDRRTDTVPFHRPCSAYYAGSANNNRTVDKAGSVVENRPGPCQRFQGHFVLRPFWLQPDLGVDGGLASTRRSAYRRESLQVISGMLRVLICSTSSQADHCYV